MVDHRMEKGLTQSELAKRSGLTVSMISKMESQSSVPFLKSYLKYVRGLDVEFGFRKKGLKSSVFFYVFRPVFGRFFRANFGRFFGRKFLS